MNQIPSEVTAWLDCQGKGAPISLNPVGGGCIHNAAILQVHNGESFFLKTNSSPPRDIFKCEAEGLRALKVPSGPVVPDVILVGEEFLLLEDLQPAPRRKDFWERYGRRLAQLHKGSHEQFGFPEDNYIGSTRQINGWMEDGYAFYRERRYSPQFRWAEERGLLSPDDLQLGEKLLDKLPELVPEMPASLIHGDLWSGNLITDSNGNPALIDPAVYYGWSEADLAMTDLFGRYPDEFYDSYLEINPLELDFRERFPIYNLYHLLNHLNIFGREYQSRVRQVLRRFS